VSERVLSRVELNRATLARQLLLERATLSPLEAIKQLAGLQSQLSNPPYIGLWSRLKTFEREELIRLLEQRQVVRASMMRCTLHLTTAEDYLHFRPALQPLHTRALEAYFDDRGITGLDKARFVAELESYLQEKPRTNVELRQKLGELLSDQDERLLYKVRIYLPLLQVFPGGVWGVGGSPAYTEASSWLGGSLVAADEGLVYLIVSYLRAFGPASLKDLQVWSGLSQLQLEKGWAALRPNLLSFRDEQGRELYDLPEAPRPLASIPAPVRFLPDFDNVVLAYDKRSRIIAEEYRPLVFPGNSAVLPTFLVDGFVAGIWHVERSSSGPHLKIQPFKPLSSKVEQELREEGELLLQFMCDKLTSRKISVVEYREKSGKQNLWGRL
jgi:hypothetical protein